MNVQCPRCGQQYCVEREQSQCQFECSMCGEKFYAFRKSRLIIPLVVGGIILCIILYFIFLSLSIQKGMNYSQKATPWGAVCEYVKPVLQRPNTAKFSQKPETIKELGNGWLYVSGTVEMLNVRGEKVIPLIEARIKEYNDLPLNTDDEGTFDGLFYKDKYYVIEKLTFAGVTTRDYSKYNEERRKENRIKKNVSNL